VPLHDDQTIGDEGREGLWILLERLLLGSDEAEQARASLAERPFELALLPFGLVAATG
jgi:hypothetical protein